MKDHNLLVVDWDYFFPIVERPQDSTYPDEWQFYDWGHSETPFHIDGPLWAIRADGFIANGKELPRTNGEELAFWDRFQFTNDATLWVAESNTSAINTELTDHINTGWLNEVWLYDAHHDCGYRDWTYDEWHDHVDKGEYSCEDWMFYYLASDCRISMRYPKWRHYGLELEPDHEVVGDVDRDVDDDDNLPDVAFSHVFVCRSGAWTPPWVDGDFTKFVERAPIDDRRELGPLSVEPRPFDMQQAIKRATQMNELKARVLRERREKADV